MNSNISVVFFFLLIATLCVFVSLIALFTSKYDREGNITEWSSPIGKIKSSSLPFLILVVGLTFGYFGFNLQVPQKQDMVKIDGEIILDQKYAGQVHAIVVGITEPRWVKNVTPQSNGQSLKVNIEVPENWSSHTAYAFVHGDAPVRPVVRGVDRDNPSFKLRLSGNENN